MVNFPGLSRNDINELALKIIKHFQPKVLQGLEAFDIDRFIEIVEDEMQIDFDFTSDLPAGVHGCTSTIDNKVLILSDLVDDPYSIKYARSTIAHETGHVILHLPFLRNLSKDKIFSQKKEENYGLNLYSKKSLRAYEDPEWQAWEFAGALLMPKPAITVLKASGSTLYSMANLFNVNKVFLDSRLRKLKMI
ncbi:ImmA/IrrE family metallo-endopeptidase [Candidatus Nomurabacteria bacterium]|nr:ImmA/IrrE family metallo-endopeptidase [Candidatus Nomurabacteria bacterium]